MWWHYWAYHCRSQAQNHCFHALHQWLKRLKFINENHFRSLGCFSDVFTHPFTLQGSANEDEVLKCFLYPSSPMRPAGGWNFKGYRTVYLYLCPQLPAWSYLITSHVTLGVNYPVTLSIAVHVQVFVLHSCLLSVLQQTA